jgi:hypothetical protein
MGRRTRSIASASCTMNTIFCLGWRTAATAHRRANIEGSSHTLANLCRPSSRGLTNHSGRAKSTGFAPSATASSRAISSCRKTSWSSPTVQAVSAPTLFRSRRSDLCENARHCQTMERHSAASRTSSHMVITSTTISVMVAWAVAPIIIGRATHGIERVILAWGQWKVLGAI